MNERIITLTEDLKVSYDGTIKHSNELTLIPPKTRHFKSILTIKSIVMHAIMTQKNQMNTEQTEKANAEAQQPQETNTQEETVINHEIAKDFTRMILAFGDDDSLIKVMNLVKSIVTNGCAKVLEANFTQTQYEELSLEDRELLTGGYLAAFLAI